MQSYCKSMELNLENSINFKTKKALVFSIVQITPKIIKTTNKTLLKKQSKLAKWNFMTEGSS